MPLSEPECGGDAEGVRCRIAERVRSRREALELSVDDLAERAMITREAAETVETVTEDPGPLWRIARVARALQVSVADLLREEALPAMPKVRWSRYE